jgi:hypothetical protein
MNDDWRVALEVDEGGGAEKLLDDVREIEVAHEARGALGDRVIVTHEDDRIFAYARTAEEAREAERVLRERLADHGLRASGGLWRWHPEEERWEPADVPLPETPAELAAEHERLEEREREETEERGFAQWEVRAELPTHRETVELAERLQGEGLPVVRRSRYLVIGAATEDEAASLAARVRREAREGTHVVVEGSQAQAWAELHPFTVLGGLGI